MNHDSWGGGRAAHGADAVGAGEVRFEMEWVGLLYSNTDSESALCVLLPLARVAIGEFLLVG
jgi:hypothetical protein